MSLIPLKGSCCLLEQETSLSLPSTGWFQEWIKELLVSHSIYNELVSLNHQKGHYVISAIT